MSLKNALISVAVIAAIGFCVCLFGGIGIDSTSKSRDAGLEATVSSVAARTDAAAADAATALEQANTVTATKVKDGKDGLACYDLNGNGKGDVEEDVNLDGDVDVLDCRGEDGASGKTGFALVTIGGKNGQDGKDCVGGGGECVFTSVCCTDDGNKPSTVTAEPAEKEKAKAKKEKAKKKVVKKAKAKPRTSHFYQTVEVEVNGDVRKGAGESPTGDSNSIENNGGTMYYAPVNVNL